MTIITERASAKINLTLDVLGRRADGYHELRSLVAFARSAFDVVELDTSRPAGCSVTGPFGATIAGKNLIEVTLAKLAAADAGLQLGHVTLTKNLPVAAGIGGGSADAAAVLRAVRRASPNAVGKIDWHAVALSLGADVPVCVHSCFAWMSGIGERVTRSDHRLLENIRFVIANPLVAVPADKTAQVFRALRSQPLPAPAEQSPPYGHGGTDLFRIIAAGRNALEHAAIEVVPEIAHVLSELAALPGAKFSRMSGGGPTCFAVFQSAQAAHAAGAALRAQHPGWWIVVSKLD